MNKSVKVSIKFSVGGALKPGFNEITFGKYPLYALPTKSKAEEKSKDTHFSLGSFIHPNNNYLEELKIKKFYNPIEYLNEVRISLYHFSPDKESRATAKGKLEIEKHARLSDNMALPIVAYRIYSTMMDLINHFYGKDNALKYADECVADWMKKRGLKKKDLTKEVKG